MVNIDIILNVLTVLAAIVFLIIAVALILNKIKKFVPNISGGINIIGGANLGLKTKLVLVEVAGKTMLLSVNDKDVTNLHTFDDFNNNQREIS